MFREDILWFIPAILVAYFQLKWIWGRLPSTNHKETEIKGSYDGLDRLKFNYLIYGAFCLFFLQLVFDFWKISNEQDFKVILKFIGYIFIVSGFLISKKALKDLGNNWTPMDEYRIKKNQVLITSGMYSLTRHPIYLAVIIEVLGFELIANSWLVIVFGLFIFWLSNSHITKEETLLEQKFKDVFVSYKTKTKKLIPFIY